MDDAVAVQVLEAGGHVHQHLEHGQLRWGGGWRYGVGVRSYHVWCKSPKSAKISDDDDDDDSEAAPRTRYGLVAQLQGGSKQAA
jgi:hypothetical protein